MKIRNYSKCLILMMFILFMLGCSNKYENQAIGYYEVGSYQLLDSLSANKIDLPSSLTLKDDKTFSLVFKDSALEGKWSANDYGDWTLVEFFIKNLKIQAQLGVNQITAINPSDFNCPELKTLVFKKVNKK